MRLKRVYDPPAAADGYRVLIDRLWPRGLAKAEVAADEWLRDIAPSTALRRWFAHDPARWDEFRRRYAAELHSAAAAAALAHLRALAARGPLTLLYAAKDEHHNHAVALRQLLGQGDGDDRGEGGARD